MVNTKVCKDCQQEKLADYFPRQPRNRDGLNTYCKSCQNKRTMASPKYMENIRKAQLKKLYGTTPEVYTELAKKQDYRCAICQGVNKDLRKKYLSVDHDHDTGKIRGLLCQNCNIGLGQFQDDPALLNKAVMYLLSHAQPEQGE